MKNLELQDIDNHKLMYHPTRVSEWLEKQDCSPIYVEFGLTNICNHHCSFCALDYLENGKKYFDSKLMISTLEEMSKMGVRSVMFAGEGEPLLHKEIGKFVYSAKNLGLDVSITTNGVGFNQQKIENILPYLSWVRISLDSGSAENYALMHGTHPRDFERVIKNLRGMVDFKRKNNLEVTIGTQFLVTNQNMGEASKLAKILENVGVDNLQIKPYSHHPNSLNNLSVEKGYYEILEKELKELNTKNFKTIFRGETQKRIDLGINYERCLGLPFFTLIDAGGNVMPCNLYYDNKEFSYGNLNGNSFSEIWNGKQRQEVIKKINEKGVSECRKGCRLDVINRYLDRLKNPLAHDNFI